MSVTIVSPAGNCEVWPDDKVAVKLKEGYRTFEDWKAEQDEIARQKRQEWLTSEDTRAERFRMLRQARDGKITATDYLMTSDYPITAEARLEVSAYRTALRDLPAQEGAPWDGGGSLTPWPVMPEIAKGSAAE